MLKIFKYNIFLVVAGFIAFCNPKTEKAREIVKRDDTGNTSQIINDKIISAEKLMASINMGETPVIIDVRPPQQYLTGHIPGAFNVWKPMFTNQEMEYGGMIAPKEQIKQLLGSLGILPGQNIIIYDGTGSNATRFWWILQYYGHRTLKILDGGITGWVNNGYPLNLDVPKTETVDYDFSVKSDNSIYADVEAVKSAIENEEVILLDVRSENEYKSGHIPGSINLEWINNINVEGDKKIKSLQELASMYESFGITKDKKIIAYCRTGMRASHTVFVLKELLGYPDVRNYDGSWTEWTYLKLPEEKPD